MTRSYVTLTYGGKHLLDPNKAAEQCQKYGCPVASFEGLANSYSCGHGTEPGVAYLLMLFKDLEALDLNTSHTLRIESQPANKTGGVDSAVYEFDQLYPVSAKCILPGREDDPNSAYLLICEDQRRRLRYYPLTRTHYNIRSHGLNTSFTTDYTGPDNIYSVALSGTRKWYKNTILPPDGGNLWTVDGIINDILNTLPDALTGLGTRSTAGGGLGDTPRPPDNIVLPQTDSLTALQWMLDFAGKKLTYNPGVYYFNNVALSSTSPRFAIVDNYVQDKEDVTAIFDSHYMFDEYARTTGTRLKIPKNITVFFRRFRDGYGLDYDTQVELTKPYYSLAADTTAGLAAIGASSGDLDADATLTLFSSVMAEYNESESLTNSSELQAAADALAMQWYLQRGGPDQELSYRFLYSGLVGLGGTVPWTRKTWGDVGNGLQTEIVIENHATVGRELKREEGIRFVNERKIVKITDQPTARHCVYPAAVYAPDAFTEASGEDCTLSATGETIYVGNFRNNKLVLNNYYIAYRMYVSGNTRTYRWVVDNQATFL